MFVLKVLRDSLELVDGHSARLAPAIDRGVEAMVDMVVDQHLLGLADGLFDGVELLGEIETVPALLEHGEDAPKVSFSSFQALDDIRMALMLGSHLEMLSPRIG